MHRLGGLGRPLTTQAAKTAAEATRLPVADRTAALNVNKYASAVDAAAVGALVGASHVRFFLELDEGITSWLGVSVIIVRSSIGDETQRLD